MLGSTFIAARHGEREIHAHTGIFLVGGIGLRIDAVGLHRRRRFQSDCICADPAHRQATALQQLLQRRQMNRQGTASHRRDVARRGRREVHWQAPCRTPARLSFQRNSVRLCAVARPVLNQVRAAHLHRRVSQGGLAGRLFRHDPRRRQGVHPPTRLSPLSSSWHGRNSHSRPWLAVADNPQIAHRPKALQLRGQNS